MTLPEKVKRRVSKALLLAPLTLIATYLILTSTLDLLPNLGTFNAKRILQIYLLGLLSLLALGPKTLGASSEEALACLPPLTLGALLIVMLLAVVSTLRLEHPGYGLAELGILFGMFCATVLVAASRNSWTRGFDRLLLVSIGILTLGVTAQETSALLANFALEHEYNFSQMLIYFSHPRFFNQLQSSMIPMLAAIPFVFHQYAKKYTVTISTVLIGSQWFILLASGGRGSLVSVVVAIIFVGGLAWRASRPWAMISAGGALLGGAIFSVLSFSYTVGNTTTGDLLTQSIRRDLTNTTGRTDFWEHALSEALLQPLLGLGNGQFQCGTSMAWPAHPHNAPLQFLAEWGFPATVLLLLVLILASRCVIRALLNCGARETADLGMLLSVSAAVLAAGLHANLSGILVMPASQVLAIASFGCLVSLTTTPRRTNCRGHNYSRGLWVSGLLTMVLLAWFSTNELKVMSVRTSTGSAELSNAPRFWQIGQSCSYAYPSD